MPNSGKTGCVPGRRQRWLRVQKPRVSEARSHRVTTVSVVQVVDARISGLFQKQICRCP